MTRIRTTGSGTAKTYQAVSDGAARLGETSTTDPALEGRDLVLLADDEMVQPAQNLVSGVSVDFVTAHSDVGPVLNALMAALTSDDPTASNARVADGDDPADVAKSPTWRTRVCSDRSAR